MTTSPTETSPQIYARIAGLLYLILVPLGIFGVLYVPSALIVPADAATTARNIVASESLFRLSILTALAVQVINLLVVLLLYKLLKPVNRDLAALMVIFLLTGVPIAMLNELNQLAALRLAGGAAYLNGFSAEQLHALVPFFLGLHKDGVLIAEIFWGLWLLPMGWLVIRSGFLLKILGVLLILGCLGYLADSLTYFLFPAYAAAVSPIATTPAGIAELLFALWLLIKGVNVEQWKSRLLKGPGLAPAVG
jgi:uncharacterized protein DUF4386